VRYDRLNAHFLGLYFIASLLLTWPILAISSLKRLKPLPSEKFGDLFMTQNIHPLPPEVSFSLILTMYGRWEPVWEKKNHNNGLQLGEKLFQTKYNLNLRL
jgi:hypothetical protein